MDYFCKFGFLDVWIGLRHAIGNNGVLSFYVFIVITLE